MPTLKRKGQGTNATRKAQGTRDKVQERYKVQGTRFKPFILERFRVVDFPYFYFSRNGLCPYELSILQTYFRSLQIHKWISCGKLVRAQAVPQ